MTCRLVPNEYPCRYCYQNVSARSRRNSNYILANVIVPRDGDFRQFPDNYRKRFPQLPEQQL